MRRTAHKNNATNKGRSLVELLAVLMIIGIVTLALLPWMRQAIDRNKATKAYKDITMRAATLAVYVPLTIPPAADVPLDWPRGFDTNSEGLAYHYYKVSDDTFAIQVNGMSIPVCRYLSQMSFRNSSLIGTTENLPYDDDHIDFNLHRIVNPNGDGTPHLACQNGTMPLFYFHIDTQARQALGAAGGCEAGFYGDGNVCDACPCSPTQTTSAPRSATIRACYIIDRDAVRSISYATGRLTCQTGYVRDAATGCCVQCDVNEYWDAGHCRACPCGSTTIGAGHNSINDCMIEGTTSFEPLTCDASHGFIGLLDPAYGRTCCVRPDANACDTGYYSADGICVPCPCGSTTDGPGATSINECIQPTGTAQWSPLVCEPGYGRRQNEDGVLDSDGNRYCCAPDPSVAPCAPNNYNDGGICVPCPCSEGAGNQTWSDGNGDITSCHVFNKFSNISKVNPLTKQLQCVNNSVEVDGCCGCAPNFYWDEETQTCVPCPCGSNSPAHSVSIKQCREYGRQAHISWEPRVCAEGYELNTMTQCCEEREHECPCNGMHCNEQDPQCVNGCTLGNEWSKYNFPQMTCNEEYAMPDQNQNRCCVCKPNTYWDGEKCTPCPCGATSEANSFGVGACTYEGLKEWSGDGVSVCLEGYHLNSNTDGQMCCVKDTICPTGTYQQKVESKQHYGNRDGSSTTPGTGRGDTGGTGRYMEGTGPGVCRGANCGDRTAPAPEPEEDKYICKRCPCGTTTTPGNNATSIDDCNVLDESLYSQGIAVDTNGKPQLQDGNPVCLKDYQLQPVSIDNEVQQCCVYTLCQPASSACISGAKWKIALNKWATDNQLSFNQYCSLKNAENKTPDPTKKCSDGDIHTDSGEGCEATKVDKSISNDGYYICSTEPMNWYEAVSFCHGVSQKTGQRVSSALFNHKKISSYSKSGGDVGRGCGSEACVAVAIERRAAKIAQACKGATFVWTATEDSDCNAKAVNVPATGQWFQKLTLNSNVPKTHRSHRSGNIYALCRGECGVFSGFTEYEDDCYCLPGRKLSGNGKKCDACPQDRYSYADSKQCYACTGTSAVSLTIKDALSKLGVETEDEDARNRYIIGNLMTNPSGTKIEKLGKKTCLCELKIYDENGNPKDPEYALPDERGQCKECSPGQYLMRDPNNKTKFACAPCPAGYSYSTGDGGKDSCKDCDKAGLWKADSNGRCLCKIDPSIYSRTLNRPTVNSDDDEETYFADYEEARKSYFSNNSNQKIEDCVCNENYYLDGKKCVPCPPDRPYSSPGTIHKKYCFKTSFCPMNTYGVARDESQQEQDNCNPCPKDKCSPPGSIKKRECTVDYCATTCNLYQRWNKQSKAENKCESCNGKCQKYQGTRCENCECPDDVDQLRTNGGAKVFCRIDVLDPDNKNVNYTVRLAVCDPKKWGGPSAVGSDTLPLTSFVWGNTGFKRGTTGDYADTRRWVMLPPKLNIPDSVKPIVTDKNGNRYYPCMFTNAAGQSIDFKKILPTYRD